MDLTMEIADSRHIDFLAHCNLMLAKETEGQNLSIETVTNGVKNLINNPKYGFYLICKNPEPVACLLVTYEWSDWRNGLIWWLQSVYVTEDYRRRGVFAEMFSHIEKLSRKEGAAGLRLYVEKENFRAQATYQRLGMTRTPYLMLEKMNR